ncbi:hypothetical protein M422DRAFT_782226 [Sphaerobolus stellatus SS14]|uniref:T6SS Phospholipase effector Tle1-like catalytic domain-containing protein n=1 Tax=Sphaerobolus stellatus (strain SS14) TaxID=990650 RepID=A0A0C9UNT0_SPHS4|nr:hypothetical protein M422DRAFT_782226 [Sphaerobolus stellatus SS14]
MVASKSSQQSQSQFTPPRPKDAGFRTLILLFDGTGDKEDEDVTNVIRLRNMLYGWNNKESKEQLVYYRPGIGTYHPRFWEKDLHIPVVSSVSRTYDQATAWSLGYHIVDGYMWLVNNYQPGDKISLFGFSRGAYTVRALAGMVNCLGLIPKTSEAKARSNEGYKIFSTKLAGVTAKKDERERKWKELKEKLANFKNANQSREVFIDFIGCWDTVNAVGVIRPIKLHFTANNDIVRVFRHALALDERRVRFKANMWGHVNRKKGTLDHPPRVITDVEEVNVWFAGCHCDVGGGSVENHVRPNLSHIPLRWMIRECFKKNTGIMFNMESLRIIGLDPSALYPTVLPRSLSSFTPTKEAKVQTVVSPGVFPRFGSWCYSWIPCTGSGAKPEPHDLVLPNATEDELDAQDALAPIYDQLELKPEKWKLLERAWLITEVYQRDANPDKPQFKEVRVAHGGKGRTIIAYAQNSVSDKFKVHVSVMLRMQAQLSSEGGKVGKYMPKARVIDKSRTEERADFESILNSDIIEWVA